MPPRFYCPVPLQARQTLDLPDAITHHAVRVLRLRTGQTITLFDGRGGEYPATLQIQGKSACAHLGDHNPREAESTIPITLVQGLPSSGKMDGIVEKAVELGVHTLVPVLAQRSPAQTQDRLHKRLEHWQRIIQAASAQCGRNRLMRIDAPQPFDAYLRQTPQSADTDALRLLCHPDGTQSLGRVLTHDTRALTLCIGPEGGWSDAELHLSETLGVVRVQFGARVLRTETAGMALVAAASALLTASMTSLACVSSAKIDASVRLATASASNASSEK